MHKLTNAQIKEIAEQLDSGLKCYWNSKSNDLVFIPDEDSLADMDANAWADEIEKIENNPDNFTEIESMDSRDSFSMMEKFIETTELPEILKRDLVKALNRPKPFWNFKYEIDNSGEYRQMWFAFKEKELMNWVKERVDVIRSSH